jgi:ribosome-associated protein
MGALKNLRFQLNGDFIELFKLLKIMNIAGSGGEAKQMVEAGLVKLNGAPESRKRAKIRPGDQVEVEGFQLHIEP